MKGWKWQATVATAWMASGWGLSASVQTQRQAASWGVSRPGERGRKEIRQEDEEETSLVDLNAIWRPGMALHGIRTKELAGPRAGVIFFRSRWGEEKQLGPGWSRGDSYSGLSSLLRGWGQMKASGNGWPTFDGQFVNYPWFRKEWLKINHNTRLGISICSWDRHCREHLSSEIVPLNKILKYLLNIRKFLVDRSIQL